MEERIDCEYYLPQHYCLLNSLNRSPFKLNKLGAITSHIVDGPFGSAIKAEDYAKDGIPFIRVADVTRGDGTIRVDDLVFITHEAHEKISRSRAVPGDVIIAKTGATMGAASVLPEEIKEANIRGDLALVGSFNNALHAHYLATYINTSIGYRLFWRLNSGSTRGRVVISNLRKFPVIWPDDKTQQEIVDLITEGRKAKNRKYLEAQQLMSSIDDYLLTELGISLPPEPENTLVNRIFTVQHQELAAWRFDPQALHPERESCVAEIQNRPAHPLRKAATFCRDLRSEIHDGAIYVGLENIESNTGRYLPSNDKESVSSAFAFRKGQILFPKLRPYLNKVFLAPVGGLCSTEFHVLEGVTVSSEFLALFLRSQLVVKQTKHLMSGNTLPRLQTEDIEALLIPEVDASLQKQIVEHANQCMGEAERLRTEAETELETAKRRIEALLLGEVEA